MKRKKKSKGGTTNSEWHDDYAKGSERRWEEQQSTKEINTSNPGVWAGL